MRLAQSPLSNTRSLPDFGRYQYAGDVDARPDLVQRVAERVVSSASSFAKARSLPP